MENKTLKRLPVGLQTYEKVVEQNCLYIDKTEYIWKMMNISNYIFLSRPRRFGKSLLVSTLQAYFEGRKELFKGLYIESVEKVWTQYPVLRFSMASAKHMENEQLERYLFYILEENERRFGMASNLADPNIRLKNLICTLHEKTGKKVVGSWKACCPNCVPVDSYKGTTTVGEMYIALLKDDLDGMLRLLQAYLLTIPYCDNTDYEGHCQQLLYVMFSLMGSYVDMEVHTPTWRVDMVMRTDKVFYLFELKFNKSAEAAHEAD